MLRIMASCKLKIQVIQRKQDSYVEFIKDAIIFRSMFFLMRTSGRGGRKRLLRAY